MRRPWRKVLFVVVALAVLAALVYYSRGAIHKQFSWTRLVQAVVRASPRYLLLSAPRCLRLTPFVRCGGSGFAVRWDRARSGACTAGTLMGYAGILLLGRAGEPVRPLLLARKCRFPVSSMFGIWLLERLFDLGATAVLVGFALLLPFAPAGHNEWRGMGSEISRRRRAAARRAGGADYAGGLFPAARRWSARPPPGRLARRRRMATAFRGAVQRIQRRAAGDSHVWRFGGRVVLFGGALGMIVVVYFWIARGFGGRLAEIDLRGAMLVLIFTLVGSTVQLPGVGGGTQVLSFIAFTQIFGVEAEPAAAAAIVLWLISFGVVCAAGIPLLIREGWSMSDLRRLARAEAEAEKAGGHIPAAADAPAGRSGRARTPRAGEKPRSEVPILRFFRRQGDRFARRPGRGFDPAAARMPEVRRAASPLTSESTKFLTW